MSLKDIFLISLLIVFLINKSESTINDDLCNIKLSIENIENEIGNYLVLVNAKNQIRFNNVQTSPQNVIDLNLPVSVLNTKEGNVSIAVYLTESELSLVHLQDLYLSSEEVNKCKDQVNHGVRQKRFSPSGHSIGIQYSVWHAWGAFAQNKIRKNGGKPQTMEQIIQHNGHISDYFSHGVTEGDAAAFYYNVEPKNGFYCTYRKRPNEAHGVVEDCADVDKTYARHAETFVSIGVDYVYVDLTNWCVYNPQEDGIQRRPMELLFEEWHKLREQKKQTPQIVAWHRIDYNNCVTWKDYLNLYNRYPDLVWKDLKTGKKVFMATKESNANIKNQIESNGGKNDVIVVNNWAVSPDDAAKGIWQFKGHCGAQQHKETVDIIGRNTCDQAVTRHSPIGDQISVGVSYQLNYASATWGASTSFYGLTFLLQWDTALRDNPQHITISGWNEFTSGPQKNPWGGYSHSVGINDGDNRVFVDLWGAFRSRDIEPTVEYGDMYFNILKSCIRVRNLNLHNNRHDCSVANEICCKINDYNQFVEVHSLIKKDNTDYILAHTKQERDSLLKEYKEICVYNPATQDFCIEGGSDDPKKGLSGPFFMFDRSGPNRVELFRCKDGNLHFFTVDVKCEGRTKDGSIGFLSTKKDSLFARSFKRCLTPAGAHYHAIDGPCHPGDKCENPCDLGFVV